MNSKTDFNQITKGFLVILWIGIVFTAYSITHKPFTPEELLSLIKSIWNIIVPAILIIIAGGIGISLKVENLNLPPLVITALSVGLGLGFLAIYVLFFGSFFNLNLSIFLPLAIFVIILRNQTLRWLKLITHAKNIFSFRTNTLAFLQFSCLMLVLFSLISALGPPIHFDALTYHFALPERYLQSGRIEYQSDNMFWGMPQLSEMLFTLLRIIANVQSGAVLVWMIGILTLIGIIGFCEKYFGEIPAWVGAISLLSGWTLLDSLSSGYVEWVAMLYGFCFFVVLADWATSKNNYSLVLAGLLTAFALGTKYTTGVIFTISVFTILTLSVDFKAGIINLFYYSSIALISFTPWLIKNFIATGNLFYPLLIPSKDFDQLRLGFYNVSPTIINLKNFLFLPFMATIFGVDTREGFSASISPWLLILSPFTFFYWNLFTIPQKNMLKIAAISIFIGFGIWGVSSQFRVLLIQTRLFFVLFPIWAVLAGSGFYILSKLRLSSVRFGNIASALLCFSMLLAVYEKINFIALSDTYKVIIGIEDKEKFLENNLGIYAIAMKEINSLPENSRVLMLWETRSFYCKIYCDPDEIIDRWYHDWHKFKNVDFILADWKNKNFDYVLINKNGAKFIKDNDKNAPYQTEDWIALDLLLSKLKLTKNLGSEFYLYSLK